MKNNNDLVKVNNNDFYNKVELNLKENPFVNYFENKLQISYIEKELTIKDAAVN